MSRPKRRTRRHAGAIRKLPSGRYQARIRDPFTNRLIPLGTFATKADADAVVADAQASQRRGSFIDPGRGRTTFAAVAQAWLESNPAKRSSSFARDDIIVRVHLVPALGSRQIADIRPTDVQALVTGWTERQSPSTIHRQYSALRAILTYAVNAEYILRTPCRAINLPALTQRRRHVVTGEELEALAAAMADYGLMAYIGATLGLRWGEVAGLRIRSVDVLARTLSIDEQVTRDAAGRAVIGPPKSDAGHRTLAMPSWLAEELAAFIARQGRTAADGDALLFSTRLGAPLGYTNWRERVWNPACVAAGLGAWVKPTVARLPRPGSHGGERRRYAGLTFHDLRRANATAMVTAGVDVKTAQTRLGHSSPTLTLAIYARATDEADRAAAEKVGDRFRRRHAESSALRGSG
jgi:integrase